MASAEAFYYPADKILTLALAASVIVSIVFSILSLFPILIPFPPPPRPALTQKAHKEPLFQPCFK